jgi:hypothetical protein
MNDARQPSQLLHNMSCGPNATIVHTGTDACKRLRFVLPGGPLTTTKWVERCDRLGILWAPTDDGYSLLVARAARPHPLLARLPAVASVLANAGGDELAGWTDNLDLILAVLSRSTAKVFLRDQAPVIATDRFQRSVTLLLPRTWAP